MTLRELTHNKIVISACFGVLFALEAWALNHIISLTLPFNLNKIPEGLIVPLLSTVLAFVIMDMIRQMRVSRKKRALIGVMVTVVSAGVAIGYLLLKMYWVKLELTNSL